MAMIYMNRLKECTIYKNKEIRYNPVEGDRRKNIISILGGNTVSDNIKIINGKMLDHANFKNYFIPISYDIYLGSNKRKRRLSRGPIYENIKASTKVTRTLTNLKDNKKQYNILYDISNYNNEFFNSGLTAYKIKIDSYFKTLEGIFNDPEVSKYKEKYLVIPFNLNKANLSVELKQLRFDTLIEFIYQLAYRNVDKLTMFEGVTCVIIDEDNKRLIKFNPNRLRDKKNLIRLASSLIVMNKIARKETLTEDEARLDDINETSNIESKEEISLSERIVNNLSKHFVTGSTVQSFTGEAEDIKDAMEDHINKIREENPELTEREIKEKINTDETIKQYAEELKEQKIIQAKNNRNMLRNKMLREEQGNVKIGDKTLNDILNETQELKIENEVIEADTVFDTLKVSNLKDFEKNYNKKLYEKDMVKSFECFSSDKLPIPMYIRKFEKEDTSDSFTKKETWTIEFEDERRVRHKIKLDVPVIMDDYYLYINGNKKTILKQFCPLPVVKTAPDTVQVVTNYNKIFLTRFGSKLSPKIERFKKFMSGIDNKNIVISSGDNSKVNRSFITTLEYDEIGASIFEINIKGDIEFILNQEHIRNRMKDMGINEPPIEKLPIAIKGKEIIYLNVKTEKIEGTELGFIDYMENEIIKVDPSLEEVLHNTKVGKSFVYTRAAAGNRDIPLSLLLSYKDGLSTILRKANIKHEFSDKRRVLSSEEKMEKGIIQFADGYLIYDKNPIANSLLLNAFEKIPTANYNFSDFDEKEAYLDIFQLMFGSRAIGKMFDNICNLMIDPLTEEVLKDLNLPTDFSELFLYANSLLSDSQLTPENHMSNYRFRSNEQIPANVYKVLADAYGAYVNAAANGSNIKFSVPQDKLMKEIVMSQNFEDYSTLNPILEVEKLNNITYKGERAGLNLTQSFTLSKRAYDPSMTGLLGISSPNNNKVGITRFLTYNPRITSARGYIEINENVDNLNASNLLTTSELITAFSSNHDDPPRTAMTTVQSKHTTPVSNADRLLIGTGADKTLSHIISNDFVFKAKKDGIVEKVDEKTGLVIIGYKDGTKEVIDTSEQISKNGNGGFYIDNTKKLKVKQGQRIKAGDVLAVNENYFSNDEDNTDFLVGTLAKVAIFSGYYTFEDSTIVSEKLCEKMTSKITMEKDVVLGLNANVDKIVKKGQAIKSGDYLMEFEESYSEKDANLLLAKIGDEFSEEIHSLGRTPIKSKYTGKIKDIKCYYTVPLEQLSPSLQKVVKEINSDTINKENIIKEYFPEGGSNIILDPTEPIETPDGKIKGVEIGEGVLIKFFIEYEDRLGLGDKITFYTAIKGVIQQTIPEELSPYSESRPDEIIEGIHPTISYMARMCGSIPLNLYGNKVMVELKRKIAEIYNE